MQNIIIIGNSGAAKECHEALMQMFSHGEDLLAEYRFKGFISWEGFNGNLGSYNDLLVGDSRSYKIEPDDIFIIGIGSPTLRKHIFESLKEKGASFFTLIDPQAYIAPFVNLGEGNIFHRGTIIRSDVTIGNANYFNTNSALGHDVVVGDYNFIGPQSMLLGEAWLGSCNSLAVQTTFLPKVKAGNNNIFAPGCFLFKGCKNSCLMSGNPALIIKKGIDN